MFDAKKFDSYLDKDIIDKFLFKYDNIDSRIRYEATIKEFISFLDGKRIININKEEITIYLDLVKDNPAKVSHAREYFKFLISERLLNSEIIDDGKFVEWVYNFRPTQKDPKRSAIQYPVNTIIQMDYDIKTNYKNIPKENKWDYERTLKIAFIWELLFDAGVQVGDLKSLKARYLFNKQEYLELGKKNKIVDAFFDDMPNPIKAIIKEYYNNLLFDLYKKKYDGFSNIKCLETYTNDELLVYGLLAQDIIAARNKFFIECPNCNNKFKITAGNWILVQYRGNNEKYLVCNICKGNANYER